MPVAPTSAAAGSRRAKAIPHKLEGSVPARCGAGVGADLFLAEPDDAKEGGRDGPGEVHLDCGRVDHHVHSGVGGKARTRDHSRDRFAGPLRVEPNVATQASGRMSLLGDYPSDPCRQVLVFLLPQCRP